MFRYVIRRLRLGAPPFFRGPRLLTSFSSLSSPSLKSLSTTLFAIVFASLLAFTPSGASSSLAFAADAAPDKPPTDSKSFSKLFSAPRLQLGQASANGSVTDVRIEAWPVVSVLHDPEKKLTLDEVMSPSISQTFGVPQSAYATLGLGKGLVWLRIPVTVSATGSKEWILDIDYSLLNRIDVYTVSPAKTVAGSEGTDVANVANVTQFKGAPQITHNIIGNAIAKAELPLRSRTPATQIIFPSAGDHEIYLRVESIGAMILPITLSTFSAFHQSALNEQMLQGVLTSLALFLLIYSFFQWASLREPLYLKYCFLVFFSAMFSMHFFGIGAQYLWGDHIWTERHMAGITSLLAAASTALFIEDAMGADMGPVFQRAIKILAGALITAALGHALDIISIQTVSVIMGTLGLMPSLLAIPGAIQRVKRGDRVGAYFLWAWGGYFIASAIMVGVVKGYVGANFWTLHSFILGATLDMLIFMRIAILRTSAMHKAAQRATLERDALHSLAHTDPLTGLLNRRGLNMTLAAALPNATANNILAVYMLDMDNFKPVNDQYGHDVGDELLMVVAARLRSTMRAGDVVARTGGDEFVVVAMNLQHDSQAKELGSKLLEIFRTPFALDKRSCHVGITVGYALAPVDGQDAVSLLKHADAAMYSGKQSGKNCLRRNAFEVVSQ